MSRRRCTAKVMAKQDIIKGNGHNGHVHPYCRWCPAVASGAAESLHSLMVVLPQAKADQDNFALCLLGRTSSLKNATASLTMVAYKPSIVSEQPRRLPIQIL